MAGPRVTNVPDKYDAQQFRQIMRDLADRFAILERLAGAYTVSNFTPTTSLDMVTADALDIGNFLCTLVSDLQKAGKLGVQ